MAEVTPNTTKNPQAERAIPPPVEIVLLDAEQTRNTVGVVRPTWDQSVLTIYSFSLTPKDDGPDRRSAKTLIPSGDLRHHATGVKLIPSPFILPLTSTTKALHAHRLEVLGYFFEPTTGELHISIGSFSHQAVYLEHGTPIARLYFTSTIRVD